jgi:hypothetical protein
MCLQTFAFGADCAKDSREGQAQLSGRGVRPKITKRDATQRAELCFSRSGDHSGTELGREFSVSFKATIADTSTFVLFTRVCSVVLQCVCSLRPSFS